MTLVAQIPATGFVPGQNLPITVELDNATSENITAVVCDLNKVATFHAMQGSKSKSRVDSEKVATRELGAVGANSSNTWVEHVRVPSLPPSYLNGCKIIDLTYSLDVRVELLGPHKDLAEKFNIVLGTVPLLLTIKSPIKTDTSTVLPPPDNTTEESSTVPLPTVSSEKPKNMPLTPVEEEPAILPLTPVTEEAPTITPQMSIKGKFTVIPLTSPKAEELSPAPVKTETSADTVLPSTKAEDSVIALPSPKVEEPLVIPLPPAKSDESQEPSGQGGDIVPSADHSLPEVPLPQFEECVLGPYNILEESDSEHTQGQLNFTPRYATYQLG